MAKPSLWQRIWWRFWHRRPLPPDYHLSRDNVTEAEVETIKQSGLYDIVLPINQPDGSLSVQAIRFYTYDPKRSTNHRKLTS